MFEEYTMEVIEFKEKNTFVVASASYGGESGSSSGDTEGSYPILGGDG